MPEKFGTYHEPFVGSGALFFSVEMDRGVISDLNKDLINLYEVIRDFPELLYGKMCEISRDKDTYYKIRERSYSEVDLIIRAINFLYLNRNCFNGLYRTNKSGKFNVPFSENRTGQYPQLNDILLCSEKLKGKSILCGDFEAVLLENVKSGDFVYLDPPYIKSEGRIFNEYIPGHFSHSDMIRLENVLSELDSRGAYFLLSFIDDEIVSSITNRWGSEVYLVQKNISGFAASRKKSPEVLVKNW